MVTSAPCSHRSAQISCAELLEPITTAFFPVQSPPVCWEECRCSPQEGLCAVERGDVRIAGDSESEDDLLWR